MLFFEIPFEVAMSKILCNIKSYIQPFERELALRELQAICGKKPRPNSKKEIAPTSYYINTDLPIENLLERLTYWESLSEDGSGTRVTRQVRRESTVKVVRNGDRAESLQNILPFTDFVPTPNRRVLRYGSHGVHEYRGKFFPQLVRSLLNIAGANRESIVLDSMCGSGTTPVEGILLGCNVIGMDINPLSVLMSRAKCDILSVNPDILKTEFESLKNDILEQPGVGNENLAWFSNINTQSQKYIANWFSPGVLNDLDTIICRTNRTNNISCKEFFLLCLSNIIRKVSWQKTDDLRVRKDVRSDLDIDVFAEFISELNKSVKLLLAFLHENGDFRVGKSKIIEGDAIQAVSILRDVVGRVDVIVTSPPYATALPYLDTDRLTLYLFGLLSRPGHRKLDLHMIGNREITNGFRERYLEEYKSRKNELPGDIVCVIDRIKYLNQGTDAGFRRQNLPSLLSKYFFTMKDVLLTFRSLLKKGSPAYVVVGNNHTVAGGERVEIATDKLLAQLGESIGLSLEDILPMEMLVSRDIFRKNTGTEETIIFFKKS